MIHTHEKHWVIIPAAGVGARMQADRPKQYLELSGRTILERTLNIFLEDPAFAGVVVALSPGDPYWPELGVNHVSLKVCEGGATRAESVLNALVFMEGVAQEYDWVWVHDAARPLLQAGDVEALRSALTPEVPGVVLAIPLADTIKRANGQGRSGETVDRSDLWRAQTPQVFRYGRLREAMSAAQEQGCDITDEASALELIGDAPALVQGGEHNIKITRPHDLIVARRQWQINGEQVNSVRIGQGFDVHAFCEGDHVVLGGITIPYEKGLQAHSDGDVLLHAVCDALLGALALGDIGKHFPDTDAAWKGADSRRLTSAVYALVTEKSWRLVNLDATIIAQAPKMAPHIIAMRESIARVLEVNEDQISVKATTTEGLGFTGRKEGIACQATVLLARV